jgi:hypothetical protein
VNPGYGCERRRRANTSANAPPINDVRPTIGPESVLPVKGRLPLPVGLPAVVTPDGDDVEVEPRPPVTAVVGVDGTVDPSPVIGVLGVVVEDGTVVADSTVVLVVGAVLVADSTVVLVVVSVVLVVASVVLVVLVSPGVHCDVSDTEVVGSAVAPSDHVPCTARTTVPVRFPGTVVVAVMLVLSGMSLPTAPLTANC